jgi:hypothetical protein
MPQDACPFCENPNFLADAGRGRATKIEIRLPYYTRQEKFWRSDLREYNATVTTNVEKRGEYLHTSFFGDDFEPRWRDFTVEVIGVEADEVIFPLDDDGVIPGPPTPFFFFASVAPDALTTFRYQHFFIARITHSLSNVELIAHWWPSHGRLFTMGGKLSAEYPNDDIERFRSAFDFFHRETRGSAKVTDADIKKVVTLLGPKATQKSAAKALNVSESTLEKWRQRRGVSTWREVLEGYF